MAEIARLELEREAALHDEAADAMAHAARTAELADPTAAAALRLMAQGQRLRALDKRARASGLTSA